MLSCSFEDGNRVSLRHVVTDNIVVHNNQILLVKRNHQPERGKWALPGGFVDRDESVEEAAMREIKEETGYQVGHISLLRIVDNPYRPNDMNRQNISFVHVAVAGNKVGKPDNESTEQRWFKLDALPPAIEMAFDHLEHIEHYLRTG